MPHDEWLATQAELFGSVFVIVQHLTRMADKELADVGLTTRQWLLLAVLTKGFPDRSPSLSEAAERYGSSRQNVKQIALGLEARGFVRLVTDSSDGRATRIEVTRRVRVFDEPPMVERTAALLEAVFAGLTPRETAQLHDLVQRWLRSLSMPASRQGGQA